MYMIVDDAKNKLGEGLYVNGEDIYWLDIAECTLFVKLGKSKHGVERFNLPEHASAI